MSGIYLHVPYCHSKCAYCDFFSVANLRSVDEYVQAVKIEYATRRHQLGCDPSTLYFGGGTPSILDATSFSTLANLLKSPSIKEFTIEVNPEDVNDEKVSLWRTAGVNRVSMGVQSLVDSELKTVGRRHSADDAVKALQLLRQGGINNISVDLIYGLPGQTIDSFKTSLNQLLDCGIEHLSAYNLSYEEGTLLTLKLRRGDIIETSDEDIIKMYTILCQTMSEAGFEHYEISNFARQGYQSRHNSSYWTGVPYLGLGPGAHSLGVDGVRRYNPTKINDYIASPSTFTQSEYETEEELLDDIVITSLRTSNGLDLLQFSKEQRQKLLKAIQCHIEEGRVVSITPNRIRVTEEAWIVADAIIRDAMFA